MVPTSDVHVRVVTWASDQLARNQFPTAPNHRTQENSLPTRLLLYCERMSLKNNWVEEMHSAKYVGRDVELQCPLHATLLVPNVFTSLEALRIL